MLPAFFTLPLLLVVALLPLAGTAAARPTRDIPEISEPELEVDVVGDVDGTYPVPQKALQDTIWIADWTFDTGAPCSAAGWEHVDGHVLNDGAIWWHVETGFTTTSGMAGNSAAVGYHDNMCCVDADGYDNDWYQGIRMTYNGNATLSFDYILDSEQYADLLQIETDSLCLSYARVNFNVAPKKGPANYRTLEAAVDGMVLNGTFGAKADFGTGSGPRSVAIGDLNGDGNPDLAVANSSSATVSVLLGNGDGTFGAKSDFETGSMPISIAIGDLNDDGKPDLAVANASSATVSVLLGNGDGTFRAKDDYRTGYGPLSVPIGDLNDDGKPDLAVANAYSNTVSVLLGDGNGSFRAKSDFGTGSYPTSVAIGDLNDDGKPDLAVANYNSDTVSVLLGNGDGTFGAKSDFGTGSMPTSVAIGDLNRDGKPDLAVANFHSRTLSVLHGNGDGTFGAKADFGTGSGPRSVAIGDLNRDGKLDLAVANSGYPPSTVSVHYGNGDGRFGGHVFKTGNEAWSVAIGDLNGDGNPDLAVANSSSNTVSVLLRQPSGYFAGVPLTNYGPGTHCVYIAFFSNGGYSPCDGDQPTTIGEGVVVDNIVLIDDSGTRIEDFEDSALDIGTFLNMADSKPFGTWARLFPHVTDNDNCRENRTCAWLWTDYTTPTLHNDPSMAFGPRGLVIRNWLDDIIVSPWVSLASTPTATGTVLAFRRFPGNNYNTGWIVQNWSVQGKTVLSGTPCLTGWGHASNWNTLSTFVWQSLVSDMTPYFDPGSADIRIRHRTSDWQWIADAAPPQPWIPGPGPYIDRARIGRIMLSGPVINEGIDSRSQAQDCFPTEIHPGVTPAGQHFRPTTDRFGSCAFSEGADLLPRRGFPNLITGDSVYVQVKGTRLGGEIVTSITWSGAIVSGPHQGKAPPPYVVGANGFFTFDADSTRRWSGEPLAGYHFADLDDFYFRGGDVLVYFWAATDNGGGFASDPVGMAGVPESVAAAQTATRGLFEVNFLPTINWAPAYLARIAAHPSGKLEPTADERAASSQENCILYIQNINSRRMSGDLNRTSFMYALDRLGYRGGYDVYDHQGMGATNNQIGGRATIQQCQGYNLIIYDNGNGSPYRPLLPDGLDGDGQKIDQAAWFRNWLTRTPLSEAGFATLWILGSNTVQEKPTNPLITADMGVSFIAKDQGMGVSPDVDGLASFTFDGGTSATLVDFSANRWYLQGGCPIVRDYDALGATGTAVQTHGYRNRTTGALGPAAIVMNRNDSENWNTIMMTFPFFDIRNDADAQGSQPELAFLAQILGATIPPDRQKSPNPTGAGENAALDVPLRTALHQNVPNPFNPTTQIRFDLAQGGQVRLRIHDVGGRLVCTLVDREMPAGRNHVVIWNGLDGRDQPVASGVYFYRLEAPDAELNRKLVVLK